MAPPHLTASKPAFQPKAGGRALLGKVNKRQNHAKASTPTFANALTARPSTPSTDDPVDQVMLDAPETATTDVNQESRVTRQKKQHPVVAALTDLVNEESLITNLARLRVTTIISPLTRKYPFKLTEAIPKSGFGIQRKYKAKKSILGNWKSEGRVAWALCADMEDIDKEHVQKVISPIFHQAGVMMQQGYMADLAPARHEEIAEEDLEGNAEEELEGNAQEELDGNTQEEFDGNVQEEHENFTQEELAGMWKRFLGKLWVDSRMKWPQKLTQKQFSRFFGALADARWWAVYTGKPDGRQPGPLAHHVSLFLDAADEAGFAWASSGDSLCDDEDEE